MDIVQVTEVLGNVGEFVGSFAVLATLVYLAVQVRHGKQLLERQDKLAMSQVFQTRAAFRMEHAKMQQSFEMAELLAKVDLFKGELEQGITRYAALSKARQVQFRAFILATSQAIENSLYQEELGLLQLPSETRQVAVRMAKFCRASDIELPDRMKVLFEQSPEATAV